MASRTPELVAEGSLNVPTVEAQRRLVQFSSFDLESLANKVPVLLIAVVIVKRDWSAG